MILQDLDPIDHSLAELVSICECLELAEPELEKKSSSKNESSLSSSSGKRRKVGFQRDRNTNLKGDCLFHGKNCEHETHNCRTMERHAEAVKKKYSDNVGHINSNCEVQNEAFMNFMDNEKARKGPKGKKNAKRSAKELKLDESSSDESGRKMISFDSDSSDDDRA